MRPQKSVTNLFEYLIETTLYRSTLNKDRTDQEYLSYQTKQNLLPV